VRACRLRRERRGWRQHSDTAPGELARQQDNPRIVDASHLQTGDEQHCLTGGPQWQVDATSQRTLFEWHDASAIDRWDRPDIREIASQPLDAASPND